MREGIPEKAGNADVDWEANSACRDGTNQCPPAPQRGVVCHLVEQDVPGGTGVIADQLD